MIYLTLWLALVVIGLVIFYLPSMRPPRCMMKGCWRVTTPDELWCSTHRELVSEESRRVGQTAESSSACSVGDAPNTCDAPANPSGSGPAYSSSAGLRLVRRCVDCGEPATEWFPCSANAGGLHRIDTSRIETPVAVNRGLRLIRPFDQERDPA